MKIISEIINDYKWIVEDYKQWDCKTKAFAKVALLGCGTMLVLLIVIAVNYSFIHSHEDYYFDPAKAEAEFLSQEKKEGAVEQYRTGLDR